MSDGRAGMENQAMGLAEAVGEMMPLHILPKRIVVKSPWKEMPAALWGDPFSRLATDGALLRPPYPALWIACGRLTVPLTLAVKLRDAGVFTVQTQAPRAPLRGFDLVVPPVHDRLAGPNVFSIVGAPNRIERAALANDAEILAPALAHLGAPRVAVLIGGRNRSYRMSPARVEEIVAQLVALAEQGAGLMITPSRRTDPATIRRIRSALRARPHFLWDGGPVNGLHNPYFGILGLADHILVTRDSVNMATDAAATGKPVHILPLDRAPFPASAAKFERFHAGLAERGVSRPFNGVLDCWSYEPLDETRRAAAEVVRRLKAAHGDRR